MADQQAQKPQVYLIGDDGEQEIIFHAHLQNVVTGEEEHIKIQVTGFNHPGAAVRALLDTALHLQKVLANPDAVEVHADSVVTDEEIAKLLGSSDN